MKNYEIVWKYNKWEHYEKLADKYRETYTSYFEGCENLIDLFNKMIHFLDNFDTGLYPEIISITEVNDI